MLSQHRFFPSLMIACLLVGLVGFYIGRISNPTPSKLENARDIPAPRSVENSINFPIAAGHAPVEDRWSKRWRELLAQPHTPERDAAMAALLEELAAIDPARAISLVQGETDVGLRTSLLEASLRGWASGDPDSAAAWAFSQTDIDKGLAMAAVFTGAAKNPEDAERLARQLSEQYPDHARDYGFYLIAALSRVGEFNRAADFAANGSADSRVDCLLAAYSRWGEQHPDAAVAYAAHLSDPDIRRTALDAAVSSWSNTDPKAVADYALTLPEGRERTFAITVALHTWSEGDVAEAATWLTNFNPSLELDSSAAEIATASHTLQQPAVAVSWAESIIDSHLRSRTLVSVLEDWARLDAAAARHYAETSPLLQAEDRIDALANINQLPTRIND